MKKLIALLLAALMLISLTACGDDTTTETAAPVEEAAEVEETPVEEEAPVEEAAAESSDVPACTDENPIVNLNGEFTKEDVQEGVLLTNIGQSADAATMAALLNKAGVAYEENDLAAAADLEGYGTLIVICGASTKGLGSAGISQEEEMARASEVLEAAEEAGMTIILAHLGGSGRRGNTSDLFIDACLSYADYMMVVEEGNSDGYFSDYCSANNIPLTLIKNAKSGASVVEDLFA